MENKEMKHDFLKTTADRTPFFDGVLSLSTKAKSDADLLANATIGSLADEEGNIITLESIYSVYNSLPDSLKASYSSFITGNPDFNEALFNWINKDNNINLYHKVIASAGGTGALTLAFQNLLDENMSVLIPQTSWGSYKLMAKQMNLKVASYKLVDENNQVTVEDIKKQCSAIMAQQGKVMVVINDPCQNPTGISYKEKWQELVNYFNELSLLGPVILINDIAYIDYAFADSRKHFSYLNNLNENVLTIVAVSCSKSLTAYGMRLGASIVMGKDSKAVDEVYNSFTKTARSLWSNVNNGLMHSFVKVINENEDGYENELAKYRRLLKERTDLFLKEAKKHNVVCYPYSEGFFITVKEDDEELLERLHKKLIDKHVYTVKFTKGLRIAICSTNKENCQRLPGIIAQARKECLND